MKKFILIQNDGEIETNSFELIGASTKRNQEGKIGFFGSGLKYSIAYMMRKGIEFKVFSGLSEVTFTTKSERLKDQSFERICINGVPTSFTTTMGPTWKEDWFVLREVYCNALDETGCLIVNETENVQPSEGKTRIFIELTDNLRVISDTWDSYFADERAPLFITENIYTCYLGHEDGSGGHHQKMSVYPKTEGVIYRKGVRVYSDHQQMFDYGFDFVNINEDRTAKNPHGVQYAIFAACQGLFDESYVKTVLRCAQDEKTPVEYFALSCTTSSSGWSDKWVEFGNRNLLVVREQSGKYSLEIERSRKEVFMLPSSFAKELKKALPAVNILGMGGILNGNSIEMMELTPKMNFLLKEVLHSLGQMNYHINYNIVVAEFDNDDILGLADLETKQILIASRTFDMGRREIAMTLMEENEHLKSGQMDETRAFQTHIFSQWLKMIEDANGMFL